MSDEKRNVVAFLNMKGGVCKTTLCKEISLNLAKRGKKILVIDIDPQANCTQSFIERYSVIPDEESSEYRQTTFEGYQTELPSIENIFAKTVIKPNIEKIILKLEENLHLIPGDLRTVFMERETCTGAAEQKLLNFIEDNNLQRKYDYIFIDCPPTYSFYTVSAILASNFYFVPVKPDIYSTLGLNLLTQVIDEMKKNYRPNFKIRPIENLGVIFTLVPNSNNVRMLNNIEVIKECYEEKGTYFWQERFLKVETVATAKLSSFIIDRKNQELIKNLDDICDEFVSRVGVFNESSNKE